MKRLLMVCAATMVLASSGAAGQRSTWNADYVKAKLGRTAETATVPQSDKKSTAAPARPWNSWLAQYFRAKYGRDLPSSGQESDQRTQRSIRAAKS